MKFIGSLVSASVIVLLAGCAATSEVQLPQTRLPASWQGKTAAGDWPDATWWARFGNPSLDALIAQAHKSNRDLQAATARIAQARANARIAGSALWPSVTAGLGAERSKEGRAPSVSSYQATLGASYEIDLWGRNRAGAAAADHAVASSAYSEAVVRIALTADVASSYFQLLSLNDQIQVAQDNLEISRKLLEVIDAQQRAGRVSALELQRQLTQVATAEAAVPPLLQQRQVAFDNLTVLLGGEAPGTGVGAASLRPVAIPAVGTGLPADLLQRRPDILRAESDLRAAHADIDAARAAVWPTLFLSGEGGVRTAAFSRLFASGSGFYGIGADVLASIFDGGRRSGQIELAEGRRMELVAAYQQAVLNAVRDVEDALAGIEQFSAQELAQQRAVDAAREAYRLAEARYRAGSTDFTTVLDAQRVRLGAEAALDPVRLARINAVIGLYRALGGGWNKSSAQGSLARATP